MGSSSGGQSRGRRVVMSEINVTPLVDVMLVLLIIFMVAAPMMHQGIEVKLPETKSSGVTTSPEPMILSIKANREIYIGEARVSAANLEGKLKAIFATKKDRQIYLQADRSVDYGFVAETMAVIRAAGIYNIGLVTLPKSNL